MKRLEFTAKTKVSAFERANGHCEGCGCRIVSAEYDHQIPAMLGGDNSLENCVVLCRACHGEKTRKADVPRIAKAKRQQAKHIGAKQSFSKPIPGSKRSRFKRKFDGTVVLRTVNLVGRVPE